MVTSELRSVALRWSKLYSILGFFDYESTGYLIQDRQ
jgi:hypothetical protein